nr:MAG TPA: hypothetical protein [Caudoviricetes sp.]
MTWSRVLIVKLPELHADVKQLEAFRAYVCDALGAGALVLPGGTTYAVEDFPPLGAVEVVAEPVPDSGTEKGPPKKELPDIPAAKGVSRPEPKPVEPPERPPEEKPDVPKPTEIKLPLAVGQATPRFAGKASSEKADIFARLNRYWSEKGPGSMIKLSEACGLDASKLYLMQRNDGKFDIEHWRAVNAGLDKLGYGGMK